MAALADYAALARATPIQFGIGRFGIVSTAGLVQAEAVVGGLRPDRRKSVLSAEIVSGGERDNRALEPIRSVGDIAEEEAAEEPLFAQISLDQLWLGG